MGKPMTRVEAIKSVLLEVIGLSPVEEPFAYSATALADCIIAADPVTPVMQQMADALRLVLPALDGWIDGSEITSVQNAIAAYDAIQ